MYNLSRKKILRVGTGSPQGVPLEKMYFKLISRTKKIRNEVEWFRTGLRTPVHRAFQGMRCLVIYVVVLLEILIR